MSSQTFTDACNTGWGAHLNDLQASGKWCASLKGRHINYLEMEAVLQAVISFKDSLKDQVTLLRTDNSTVAAYIKRGHVL
jgi:ribonuclease HI